MDNKNMDSKNGFAITERDRVLRAWQNSTELVRDYRMYAREIGEGGALAQNFEDFAEDEARHASVLLEQLQGYDSQKGADAALQ